MGPAAAGGDMAVEVYGAAEPPERRANAGDRDAGVAAPAGRPGALVATLATGSRAAARVGTAVRRWAASPAVRQGAVVGAAVAGPLLLRAVEARLAGPLAVPGLRPGRRRLAPGGAVQVTVIVLNSVASEAAAAAGSARPSVTAVRVRAEQSGG